MGKRCEPSNIRPILGSKVAHLFSYFYESAFGCPPSLRPGIAGADSFSIYFHSFQMGHPCFWSSRLRNPPILKNAKQKPQRRPTSLPGDRPEVLNQRVGSLCPAIMTIATSQLLLKPPLPRTI